jgi:membrane protein DedA with SNARE-associated domain
MKYGYLAIFILVFLQETGMPNPFPNELLLIISGYLSFKGLLFAPFVILTAVSADFIGTNILYFLFYNTGTLVFQKKPKWIPLSPRMIDRLSTKISRGGQLSIFIFRLTPFTRGYTSVITGLIHVKPKIFLPIAFLSALTWAIIYMLTGYLLGPSWNIISLNFGKIKFIMLGILMVVICLVLLVCLFRKRKSLRTDVGS